MPRARRSCSSLFGDFSRHLRELGSSKHWDETTFLLLLNEEKDLLEMQLQMRHEGFSLETWTTSLVASQQHYQIPTHVNRIKRVLRFFTGSQRLVPLTRNELVSTPTSTQSGSVNAVGTYRMIDDYIVLDPIPSEAVANGLKIEAEVASERLTSGSDIPTSFPIFSETLLVLRCMARAWAEEESEDATRPLPGYFVRRVEAWENEFASYTTTRTYGRNPGVRFAQGG